MRANPKVFIGYSDHTSLHCWLQREANLVTFYGPMVAADFARDGWRRCGELEACVGRRRRSGRWACSDGLRVLRAGVAEGTCCGRMYFDLCGGAGHAVCVLPAMRMTAYSVSGGHWDEAVPVGPDAAASALCGDAGACERDCVWRYAQCVAAEEMALLERRFCMRCGILRGRLRLGCGPGMWMRRILRCRWGAGAAGFE